jgi:hypothetical protein
MLAPASSRGEFEMRASIAAALAAAILIMPGFAVSCVAGTGIGKGIAPVGAEGPAQTHTQVGTVTDVNSGNMTFGCHWKTGDWTFWVTPGTNIRVGSAKSSFADIKTGEFVEVQFHFSGKRETADLVVLTP